MIEPPSGSIETLRSALAELRRARRILEGGLRLLTAAVRGDVLSVLPQLRKDRAPLESAASQLKLLAERTISLRLGEALAEAIADAKRRYREDLEEHLRQAGIPFAGQWPTYLLNDIVELHIDLARDRVRIDRRWLQTLGPKKVVVASRRVLAGLLGRPFDPEVFASTLLSAYEECIERHRPVPGDYLPIKDLFKRFQMKQGSQYTIRHFSIDLIRLLDMTADPVGPLRLELSPARGPRTGIFLPGPSRGYISGIRIKRTGRT